MARLLVRHAERRPERVGIVEPGDEGQTLKIGQPLEGALEDTLGFLVRCVRDEDDDVVGRGGDHLAGADGPEACARASRLPLTG
jgi:hypothetical protein